MAATDQMVHVSFPIFKFDRTPDGDLIVYGKCTDGTVDADHQIVDPKWSGKALEDWLVNGGNVRVQHSPFLYPAGKGMALEIDRDGDNGHWLKALVVKETPAHGLVEKRILKDFSIGILDPVIVYDNHAAPGGTIKGGKIGEVSLVDRGSNKNTTFEIAKAMGNGPAELVYKMTSLSPMANMVALGKKKKKIVDSGGQDRSDVPASDFAGPHNTFPIEHPSDVPDAASLAHHADNPAQVRNNIKRIARRKFGKDAQMPPSLQEKTIVPDIEKDDDEGDTCALCHGTGKIRGGKVDCPDCKGKGLVPDVTKGDAAQDYPGDSDTDEDSVADYEAGDGDDDDDDKKKAASKAMRRAVQRQRRVLNKAARDADEAERGNNGGRAPSEVQGHADPDAAESGFASAKDKKMVPAGKHREPDGAQAEGIEEDAGMHSSDEAGDQTGVPGSHWSATKSAPSYGMQRLHDATCPHYRFKDVRKSYGLPRDVGAAIPVREIESLAMDAIVKGSLDEAAYFTQMLETASSMQHLGPDVLLDARKALPSMFPTAHPHQQTDIRPSQFQRGYVSAGHPALSAGSEHGHSALPPAKVHEVSAQDFKRGYLSDGRADASPGEGTQARASTAAFGQALNTLSRMHQQVSSLWPDMCPANVTQRDYTSGEGSTGIRPASMSPAPAAVPGSSFTKKSTEVALRKALAAEQARVKELQEEVALLGSLPDPEQAPYRGLPQLDGPVDRDSFVGKAFSGADADDDEDAEFLEFMNGLAASGDPRLRMNATKAIRTLLTK